MAAVAENGCHFDDFVKNIKKLRIKSKKTVDF